MVSCMVLPWHPTYVAKRTLQCTLQCGPHRSRDVQAEGTIGKPDGFFIDRHSRLE
jgi:hypothetical protein